MMDWQSCERCKHELKDGKKGSPCFDCGIEAKGYEPKTNADRIRNMTDEELADFLHNIGSYVEDGEPKIDIWLGEEVSTLSDCCASIKEWLQAEVKEGNFNENT